MSILEMSEEEKSKIRKQHQDATNNFFQKKAEVKQGLRQAEKPKEEKTEKKEEEKKAAK